MARVKTNGASHKPKSVTKRKNTSTYKSDYKKKTLSNTSKPKKKFSTFKRVSSRQADAVKSKKSTSISFATKTNLQQEINVTGDGCKNKKRKNSNDKEKQKSTLSSHSASHHNSRCNLCTHSEPKARRGKSTTKSNGSFATKTNSQQKINLTGGGCKNRKRKNKNDKEKQKCKRNRLSSHSASHHNSRCNLCTQPEPKAPRGKSTTKTNGSFATKTNSQQEINVTADGCKNRKRKNNNDKEKQKSKRKRLSSHSAVHHNSRCNLCTQPEPTTLRGKSTTKSKGSNQYRVVVELPCKKSVFEKACNLRRTIESGDLLPASLQPLLNDSVANNYDINELVATVKESKCKWQETEKRMLELDHSIRAELCINKANPEKSLPFLDELTSLDIDALMLKKNPRFIHTLQRLCQFVGNRGGGDFTEEEKTTYLDSASQIRCKSKALFQKCQKLFNIEEGQSFVRVFKDKVQEYQETRNSKFLRELCQRVNKGFKKNQISRPLKKRVSGNTK